MTIELPKYVYPHRIRGVTYYYFHKGKGTPQAEKPVRLPDITSAEFWPMVRRLSGCDPRGMVEQMVDSYLTSKDFEGLAEKTRTDYTRYCHIFRGALGKESPAGITPMALTALRDEYAETPVAANTLLSVIQSVYTWAIPLGYAPTNPVLLTNRLKHKREGHEPWPAWAFAIADKHMRFDFQVAVRLGRFTGQRLTDVIAMQLPHIDWSRKYPVISVVQSKTGKPLRIPAHPDLMPTLQALRERGWYTLVAKPTHNRKGSMVYTAEQFQAAWGREMAKDEVKPIRDAGLSFHGLRKSAAVCLAEVGCSDEEIWSITGLSRGMIKVYTAGVNQLRVADNAMAKWRGDDR